MMGQNITCPLCRFRHPAAVTCEQAKRAAIAQRVWREQNASLITKQYAQALEEYQSATANVDATLGAGAAVRIITLMEAWKKLGEFNE